MKSRGFSGLGKFSAAGLKGWVVCAVLLGTLAYAVAEEITLTTYYPSPRGVYNELRTQGNVQIGSVDPPAVATDAPRLHVIQDTSAISTAPALRVDTRDTFGAITQRLVIDKNGNVGIGRPDPSQRLEVNGIIRESIAGGRIYGSAVGNYGGRELVITVGDGAGGSGEEVWIGPNTGTSQGHITLSGDVHVAGCLKTSDGTTVGRCVAP